MLSATLALAGISLVSAVPLQDRLLAVVPAGTRLPVPPAFSADGRTVAYVARTEAGDQVVRGDWRGPLLPFV